MTAHDAKPAQKGKAPTLPTAKFDRVRDEKKVLTTFKGWPFRYFGSVDRSG